MANTNSTRDHPRVCGEHPMLSAKWLAILGSSPRMRGTCLMNHLNFLEVRIIPAYAGNMIHLSIMLLQIRDHPRVCGEHILRGDVLSDGEGSSPRMRGTFDNPPFSILAERIIPAYAGNISRKPRKDCPQWDHPRVCGEHLMLPYTRCAL